MLLALWHSIYEQKIITRKVSGGAVRFKQYDYEKQSSEDFLKNYLTVKQREEEALILLLVA